MGGDSSPKLVHFAQPAADVYLEDLQKLANELEIAMKALGCNALVSFEESVSRQKTLCAGLERSIGRMQKVERLEAAEVRPAIEGELAQRILAAGASLSILNQQYAALLQHTSDSVRLFAALCGSYTGHFQYGTGAGTRVGRHVLSCEL